MIWEVSADDKDFHKVIADACLRLEDDAIPVMPCTWSFGGAKDS